MGKLEINFPLSPENIKPNKRAQRRFSTGNSIIKINEQRPIPNYLRASIGSCHDLCKYGAKRAEISPRQEKTDGVLRSEAARSKTNPRGRKVLDAKNTVPVPSRSRKINDSGKGMRSGTPASRGSSGKNITTSKSSNLCRKPSLEVKVPEKIIHVVEERPNAKLRVKAPETENDVVCTSLSLRRAVSHGEIEVSHGEIEVSHGEIEVSHREIKGFTKDNDVLGDEVATVVEKSAPKVMTRTKVKALVDAFETLISIQDSPTPTAYVWSELIGVKNAVLRSI